jgi:hypothetical protein
MLGLALMAAKLAEQRVGYGPMSSNFGNVGEYLCPRSVLPQYTPDLIPFSCEYYAICDRITRGEKP